ncbi:MAG: 50S ribosomal protein L17 [Candidatus Moranbacteria bacterium]|nr:50S ribosomal protein L17 [Candidatus Moranbacteria bacterium]MDZ4385238.1 50S ribosomal protein L17 [Candidatus Moranbacteria bacterium]
MKHLQKGRKLGRVRNQRTALFRTLLGSLVMEEKIKTTEAKAKEMKSMMDKLINKAKLSKDEVKKIAVLRALRKNIPLMAVKKLTGGFLDKFSKRSSGYTRIIKLAPRQGDAAKIAVIEFVD